MGQKAAFVSLGELLNEAGESAQENEVLGRVKLLAQELLPEGWTSWQVTRRSKQDIFGDNIDLQMLNKIRFALPADQLVKAFLPEATHLSERGLRDLKLKMLDWEFGRALLTSPPSICNQIRGSAAATESFNAAVKPDRLMPRREAKRHLSVETSTESDSEDQQQHPPKAKQARRLDILEQRLENMYSLFMQKLDVLQGPSRAEEIEISDQEYSHRESSRTPSVLTEDFQAPALDDRDQSLEFLSEVKEVRPAIPKPSEEIMEQGIHCQRFGLESWNRIRYIDAVKGLHASPVFSALKVNPELRGVAEQNSGFLNKMDGILGTITHGLLCQRKHLVEEFKKLARKFPEAVRDLNKVLSEGSEFKRISDDLLQFVCAHRAEIIDMKRKEFKPKSKALAVILHEIPPSPVHIFDGKKLADFLKDHGGIARIFPSRSGRFPDRSMRDGSGRSGSYHRIQRKPRRKY